MERRFSDTEACSRRHELADHSTAMLAGSTVRGGLLGVARGAAGSEVPGRGGAPGHVGLLMIPLEAKPVAAIDADWAIEGRRGAEVEGDANRGGNAPGPTSQVSQVGPIVEEPAQEGVLGDLSRGPRCNRPHAGNRALLTIANVVPSPLSHLVADQHDQFGAARGAALAG